MSELVGFLIVILWNNSIDLFLKCFALIPNRLMYSIALFVVFLGRIQLEISFCMENCNRLLAMLHFV